jgi:hypothetical protein
MMNASPLKGLKAMENLIYSAPSFIIFALICIVCILISFVVTKLVHRYIPLKFRYAENQAIVCISAFLGILYAMLVGFTILYELNSFNKADDAEDTEAKAMYTIYRLARSLPEPTSTNIRAMIVAYGDNVVNNEWPALANGKHVDKTGVTIIGNIASELRSYKNLQGVDPVVINALNAISINASELFDDHQVRVSKIHSSINGNIWFVLLLGSFLCIAINCMLGMELRLHLACTIFVAFMVSAVLYLIITLDRPYRGDFSIKPDTFISTLDYMKPHT